MKKFFNIFKKGREKEENYYNILGLETEKLEILNGIIGIFACHILVNYDFFSKDSLEFFKEMIKNYILQYSEIKKLNGKNSK